MSGPLSKGLNVRPLAFPVSREAGRVAAQLPLEAPGLLVSTFLWTGPPEPRKPHPARGHLQHRGARARFR
jgi:hypothetical protein